MKFRSAKRYIQGYKKSVETRGAILDRDKLKNGLRQFESELKHSGLLGKH